jgi:hypothetical protein
MMVFSPQALIDPTTELIQGFALICWESMVRGCVMTLDKCLITDVSITLALSSTSIREIDGLDLLVNIRSCDRSHHQPVTYQSL